MVRTLGSRRLIVPGSPTERGARRTLVVVLDGPGGRIALEVAAERARHLGRDVTTLAPMPGAWGWPLACSSAFVSELTPVHLSRAAQQEVRRLARDLPELSGMHVICLSWGLGRTVTQMLAGGEVDIVLIGAGTGSRWRRRRAHRLCRRAQRFCAAHVLPAWDG